MNDMAVDLRPVRRVRFNTCRADKVVRGFIPLGQGDLAGITAFSHPATSRRRLDVRRQRKARTVDPVVRGRPIARFRR